MVPEINFGQQGQGGERQEVPQHINLAVLVSNKGTGSNLRGILAEQSQPGFNSRVGLVLADTEDAAGIQIAKERRIPTEVWPYKRLPGMTRDEYRDQYSRDIADILNYHGTFLSVFAGFNRILTAEFFKRYRGIGVNVHPGALPNADGSPFLLPDTDLEAPWNKGMMTDAAVEKFLGLPYAVSTIHVVSEEADSGEVLDRAIIPTQEGDTVDSLYGRLKVAESQALLRVLRNPPLVVRQRIGMK